MRKLLLALILIIFISNVSASCEEGQIDINTALAEELDQIVYIGPARAEQIIALRPFDSVDDMIRILGIGEVYLNAIKEQGLACVNGQEEEESEEEDEINATSINGASEDNEINGEKEKSEQSKERETIVLNPQVIKSENDNENLDKNNYAVYGFVFFCILIGILFMIKNRKYKNEFR